MNLFDTHKFAHVIACGARAAEEHVPYLRQLLALPTAQPSGPVAETSPAR